MLTVPRKLITAEELLAMGTDFHGELVRGRLIEMAPASWGRGMSGSNALLIIGNFVREHKLGRVFTAETGFTLSRDPDSVRAPDVAFVATDRIPTSARRSGFFDGAPDLAVEIISPNDSFSELSEKIDEYLAAGTRIVWVIDDRRKTITVYANNAPPTVLPIDARLTGGDLLPGFDVPVQQFFE